MRWRDILFYNPSVEHDGENTLVVEELHFGPIGMSIVALGLASLIVIPVFRALHDVQVKARADLLAIIIIVAIPSALVIVPFLIVLAMSRYRRLEVRDGAELISTVVYTVWSPRTDRVAWDEIDHVQCEKLGRDRRSAVRLTLHRKDGKEQLLLKGGWDYSNVLAAGLGRHLGDKFKNTGQHAW
jgi:hypothetical protein